MITLLVTPEDYDAAGEIAVEGETYRHLFRARRAEVGDPIRLVDGLGAARAGRIVRIDRKAGWIAPIEPIEILPSNEPALRLALLVPTLRPERASWLVEKATEMGVGAIRFLHTERAPREFGSGTLERLRRIAVSALEQCHGATLPTIDGPHGWNELASLAEGLEMRWVLDPGGTPGLVVEQETRAAALLVGPEGGLTGGELGAARALGFRPVALGPRILRIETAALAGAALALLRAPRN
ncbi:MAG TPA: RsmE family RNA methyltransferase [Thermoanaerobaculia bacterium]|nr:RsmE family RNA methyltransferase [Thermoanaerobaculia bacterium]